MSLFSLTETLTTWPWSRHAQEQENRWAHRKMREEFIALPYKEAGDKPEIKSTSPSNEMHSAPSEFTHEAMVRDPLSGEKIGRVRLKTGDRQKQLLSFQLMDGHLKKAWADESILLICPQNGPAKYSKILAYPPDGCDVGILQIQQ